MESQTQEKTSLSFAEGDFAADMAKLQAEIKPTAEVNSEAVITPTVTPVQPQQATVTPEPANKQDSAPIPQAVTVPEKFKSADGTLDTVKLEKSSLNVDQALAKYLEKEKELKRKINEVKTAENQYLNPSNTPTPIQTQTPANIPFRQQLAQDIQSQGIEVVLEKLFSASQEAALEQARKELTPLKQGFEEATTRQQIEAIGRTDPWVYTEQGVSALNQILNDNPALMQFADPYKAAYVYHRGLNGVTQQVERVNSQVLIPTPTAKAMAPVPSAVAASITPTAPTIRLDSQQDIDAHLKTLTPKQQEEFFVKLGLPAFDIK